MREPWLLGDTVAQCCPFDEIADNVVGVLDLAGFVHGNNVGMPELCSGPGLTQKLFHLFRRKLPVPGDFDRHDSVQLCVQRFPHTAEAPHAYSLTQLKVSKSP